MRELPNSMVEFNLQDNRYLSVYPYNITAITKRDMGVKDGVRTYRVVLYLGRGETFMTTLTDTEYNELLQMM